MDNIKWGPERECTGEQPCPNWVLVRVKIEKDWYGPWFAKSTPWATVDYYQLPAEHEALLDAKELTHEQMREALAERYEGIPDALVEIDPVKAAYKKTHETVCWSVLSNAEKDRYRVMFKAGQEHSQKHSS